MSPVQPSEALVDEVWAWFAAERDQARRAARTLGGVVDRQCRDVLAAVGIDLGGDLIDETGDGDWSVVWEQLAALRPERDEALALVASGKAAVAAAVTETARETEARIRAEAALARVEALTYADDDGTEYSHTAAFTACEGESTCPACWAASIRAALRGER